jgi:hypothetical protein
LFDAEAIGLVDDENIGDFHHARFDGLDIVSHAGNEHYEGGIGGGCDIDFILPCPDCFHEDEVEAYGAKETGQRDAGSAESALRTACCDRTDEDAGIGVVILHAYAIAENRTAGRFAGWVNRDDGDGLAATAQFGSERTGERTFTDARWACDSDDEPIARREVGWKRFAVFNGCGKLGQFAWIHLVFQQLARND